MAIMAIVIEILLALAFLGSGLSKAAGAKMQVESFNKLGLPQWFRVVTGLLQLVAVAGLVVGFWYASWSAWAAVGLAFIMVCGVIAHIRAKDAFGQMVPALVLAILAIVLACLQGSDLGNFPN
ncbi:DoxX family protein [Paenibacillus sp. MWE-103]|uniref:DoxX family protein n=2 Tax=Paenibacillus artemisiicola TaxID=1172618 RepID=A0ABS3WD98_9BACL|nr:DoxX family protein [Paenibacillus artemisiicola]